MSWPWWPFPQPARPSGSPLTIVATRKTAAGGTTEDLDVPIGEGVYIRAITAWNDTDVGTIQLYIRLAGLFQIKI